MVRTKTFLRAVILIGLVAGSSYPAFPGGIGFQVTFNEEIGGKTRSELIDLDRIESAIPGPVGEPALPWLAATLPADWPKTADLDMTVLEAETLLVETPIPVQPADLITSDTVQPIASGPSDDSLYIRDVWFPSSPIRFAGTGQFQQNRVTSILWCPFRYNPAQKQLIVIRRAVVTPDSGQTTDAVAIEPDLIRTIAKDAGRERPPLPVRSPADGNTPTWVWSDGLPHGVDYVVITTAPYVASVRPLVEWKARRGLSSGIATVEAISAAHPAVDVPASIREYVKAAHAQGLKWVVLGGDETIVPVRYAYAGLGAYDGNPYNLQICDMYYGELDGNWDTDGDGIWGEYFDDDPQIYPEVYVGRLPFSDAAEAAAIVVKTIAYERGPANADYLTRALGVSADQMRDWSSGIGQHALVAEAMPGSWTKDLTTMVEAPSGSDPAPQSPAGETLPSLLENGVGWVNYFVHGKVDAFVVRSAGIMQLPRTHVYTDGSSGDGDGHLNMMAASPFPGVHLSIACDQGAFDFDSPPFSGAPVTSVGERLVLSPQGGAVAFIGQSRWGWVAISYRLVRKFYEYLNDATLPNHIGEYQTLAKIAFPSYTDLIYGNNLLGDPEMPVWKSAPLGLDVAAPNVFVPGPATWGIEAFDDPTPVAGALVTVQVADSVWTLGETDADGQLLSDWPLPFAPEIILTVGKSGHRTWVDTIPISIIADVKDDQTSLPTEFDLLPNYPNPFNPATQLRFTQPKTAHVNLSVFDVLGRRVTEIVDEPLPAGSHERVFTGVDGHGRTLCSGIYFARLSADGQVRTRTMVLVR